jgi:hypothetical protein
MFADTGMVKSVLDQLDTRAMFADTGMVKSVLDQLDTGAMAKSALADTGMVKSVLDQLDTRAIMRSLLDFDHDLDSSTDDDDARFPLAGDMAWQAIERGAPALAASIERQVESLPPSFLDRRAVRNSLALVVWLCVAALYVASVELPAPYNMLVTVALSTAGVAAPDAVSRMNRALDGRKDDQR